MIDINPVIDNNINKVYKHSFNNINVKNKLKNLKTICGNTNRLYSFENFDLIPKPVN